MPEANDRPPISHAPLSVVLPAHNVELDLRGILAAWHEHLDCLNRDYELLVIDDGSTDRTGPLAEELASTHPRLKVIRRPARQGIGAALRSGLAEAKFPLFFYAQCTIAFQPRDLDKLLEVMDHVDLATGIRVWQRDKPRWSLGDVGSRLAFRFLFGLRLRDVDCAFKLFRRSIFARIPIQADSSFVHTEILAKANFLGCMMAEVEVAYSLSGDSNVDCDERRQRRREALRLFRHPDFGPTELPVGPLSEVWAGEASARDAQ